MTKLVNIKYWLSYLKVFKNVANFFKILIEFNLKTLFNIVYKNEFQQYGTVINSKNIL